MRVTWYSNNNNNIFTNFTQPFDAQLDKAWFMMTTQLINIHIKYIFTYIL